MDDSSSPEKSSLEETSRNPALGIAALAIALHRKSNNVSSLRTMDTSTPSSSSSVVSSSSSSSSNNLATAHANHPFFHYYGLLIHQQNMLQDLVRTGAYHDAIMRNASDFEGKVCRIFQRTPSPTAGTLVSFDIRHVDRSVSSP